MPVQKASAANFSQFIIFGDSLSDTGNVSNITQSLLGVPIPPSPPYAPGRFSNGEVWVDYLGKNIGLTPTLFTDLSKTPPTQGINFSVGGSSTGDSNAFIPNAPGVSEQASLFTQLLQANNQKADPNALYAVWGGGNDYLFGQNFDVEQTIKDLSNTIGGLAQAGAKNILVFNLPDLGKSPLVSGSPNASNLTTLTNIHNAGLTNALGSLSNIPGINLIPVDVNSLFERVVANPEAFGFKNAKEPCVVYKVEINQVLSQCDNPNDYVFFDEVHPSTNAHKLVAQTALAAIRAKSVPESSASLGISVLGALGVVGMLKRKHKQRTFSQAGRVLDEQSSQTVVES
ncbi:SGNH/GDSL hydrolase family protein [Scytonema sp. NUACC21]